MASTGRTRPIILDSGPGAKLLSAKLSEAEYRGERAKVLRDSASQYLGHRKYPKNSHGNATFPDQEISLRLYQGWIFTGSWWFITP